MDKLIYLLGGGKGFNNKIGEDFRLSLKHANSIAFIPTSPEDKEKCEKYKNINLQWFREIEIDFKETDIIDIDDTAETSALKIKNKDVIFLMGGDPVSQLNLIKNKSIDKILKNYNGIIIGISAGAISICDKCIITKDEDFSENFMLDGINLTDGINVEVHYDSSHDGNVKEVMKLGNIDLVYTVPEDCAIRIENGELKFIGDKDFYIFKGETKVRIEKHFHEN